MTQVSISEWKAPGRRISHCSIISSAVAHPGRRWHLPSMPTTLNEDRVETTLARQFLPVPTTLLHSELALGQNERQLLRSQQRSKECARLALRAPARRKEKRLTTHHPHLRLSRSIDVKGCSFYRKYRSHTAHFARYFIDELLEGG